MIFLPRLLPFLCLLMLLPRFSHGSPSSFSPVSILVLMSTFSGAHAVNKCLTSGEYFKINASGSSVTNGPENGTLKEVGNKFCAFRFTKSPNMMGCTQDYTVEFTAVELTEKIGPFCSYWRDHAVCVCDSFGCNFATGMLYETAIYSYKNWQNGTGKIVGEDYAAANLIADVSLADAITNCVLDDLQNLYSAAAFTRPTGEKFRKSFDDLFVMLKESRTEMFPNNATLEKLAKAETTVSRPTPASPGGSAAGDAATSSGTSNRTRAIGGALFSLLLSLSYF